MASKILWGQWTDEDREHYIDKHVPDAAHGIALGSSDEYIAWALGHYCFPATMHRHKAEMAEECLRRARLASERPT